MECYSKIARLFCTLFIAYGQCDRLFFGSGFLSFLPLFEFMLLPMYFLIGLWGVSRREYAALKFFIYTFFGSLLILIVMIALYLSVIHPLETARAVGILGMEDPIHPDLIYRSSNG